MDMIRVKRVYESADKTDGQRILVERLWPRGVRKRQLALDLWVKEVAPSHELRKWFGHDPEKWAEFQARYFKELAGNSASYKTIIEASSRGVATLLFSARDPNHNNAVALKTFLERKMKRAKGQSRSRKLPVAA
jgi:uncharacterized protein YeaO (DUF488 family)